MHGYTVIQQVPVAVDDRGEMSFVAVDTEQAQTASRPLSIATLLSRLQNSGLLAYVTISLADGRSLGSRDQQMTIRSRMLGG